MTKSEHQELVEFIAPKFERIDERFDAIDERFDAVDERFDAVDKRFAGFDERLRRVEILGEENRHQIQIVAEAVSGNDRRLEAFRSEVAVGFQDLRELLQASHLDLDRRVTRLEEGRRRWSSAVYRRPPCRLGGSGWWA